MVKQPKPGPKKRNVQHRFPGIDRSASRTVYNLETRLALTQRELRGIRAMAETPLPEIAKIYKQLAPGNRRQLMEYALYLLGSHKKK